MTTSGTRSEWGRLAARAVADLRTAGVDDATVAALAIHLPLLAEPVGPAPEVVAERDGARSLGELHQELLDDDHRHRKGVHYTPPAVAAALVARVLGPTAGATTTVPLVCDPSCGGGVFLVAVAEHLTAHGADPAGVMEALHGIDIDPVAVDVARIEVAGWAAGAGLGGEALVEAVRALVSRIVVGDALVDRWPGEGRLDAVVGNPPFAGQLGRRTARDDATATAARALLGGAAPGYADSAGLFLVRAAVAAAPGGRISLIQPLSFLGSRDAGVVRRRLDELAVLTEVWVSEERVFGAAVDVCAPVLQVSEPFPTIGSQASDPGPVVVSRGSGTDLAGAVARSRLTRAGTWAPVVASAAGVPAVDLEDRDRLGSWARATAGFRDEFYALVPYVRDLLDPASDPAADLVPELPPGHAALVTAGLVEPARVLWGRHPTRFSGRRLLAPAVDVGLLRAASAGPDGDRRLAVWADARLRPKVVVATQTRTVEAAVDHDGSWWPSVPVISVVLDPEHDSRVGRGLVAAALMAPPVTAWAAERSAGTAMARHALKLRARQLHDVPLPVDDDAWAEGARLLEQVAAAADGARPGLLAAAGRVLTAAHALPEAVDDAVLRWWAPRAGCAEHV